MDLGAGMPPRSLHCSCGQVARHPTSAEVGTVGQLGHFPVRNAQGLSARNVGDESVEPRVLHEHGEDAPDFLLPHPIVAGAIEIAVRDVSVIVEGEPSSPVGRRADDLLVQLPGRLGADRPGGEVLLRNLVEDDLRSEHPGFCRRRRGGRRIRQHSRIDVPHKAQIRRHVVSTMGAIFVVSDLQGEVRREVAQQLAQPEPLVLLPQALDSWPLVARSEEVSLVHSSPAHLDGAPGDP